MGWSENWRAGHGGVAIGLDEGDGFVGVDVKALPIDRHVLALLIDGGVGTGLGDRTGTADHDAALGVGVG